MVLLMFSPREKTKFRPWTLYKCDFNVCEPSSAQSLSSLIQFYFTITGSNFSYSWHNLHDCEYDSHCNGLDLQPPKFQTSLTCGDNQVLFIPSMFLLCAPKDTWMGLLFLASNCNILKTVSGKVTRTQWSLRHPCH